MQIPFADLKKQYLSIKTEIDAEIEDILTNTAFIGGPKVKQFEEDFAQYIGVQQVIGCANGTDAIEIALQAMGIGVGDEVIVPAMSWISTSESVTTIGAIPIFADILADEYTIDPVDVERKITSKTKAIIPVHFYGCPAQMDQIMAIAKRHKLKVLEDGAQAHGAQFYGQTVGTFGDIATFSFYPGKNLGAYGDAGAIVTNDVELSDKCRMMCNHGQLTKHNHQIEGRNSRLDTLQAAVLSVKLKYLNQWTDQRIAIGKLYNELLQDANLQRPVIADNSKHVFHVYAIQVADRNTVQTKLADLGVATQIHYPKSLPEHTPYKSKFNPNDYPNSKKLGAHGLSLPLFPELTQEEIDYVVKCVKSVT